MIIYVESTRTSGVRVNMYMHTDGSDDAARQVSGDSKEVQCSDIQQANANAAAMEAAAGVAATGHTHA
jgi:hypothetical protein